MVIAEQPFAVFPWKGTTAALVWRDLKCTVLVESRKMEYTLPREGSMPIQQKMYTREFKVEAVQLAKSSGKPMSQIAQEL
jgi:hypothetical protein